MPAVVGISSLAYPIYTAFYDSDPLGGQVLMWYAPVALLFALFTVTAAILQGINQQKHAIIALIMGVILKFVCNVIFIRYFGTVGAILATAVGFLASVWYTNQQIKKYAHYSFGVVYKRTFQIAVLTLIMVVAVKLSQWILSFMISPDGRIGALITVAICAGIGGLVYGLLAIRTGVLERVFGGEALDKIQRKLGSRFKIKLKSRGA